MNLFFAREDSLALMRQVRMSEDLILVPANHEDAMRDGVAVKPEYLAGALPPNVLSPSSHNPVNLRFPDAAQRSCSRLVRASTGLAALPKGSYLEVLSRDGRPLRAARNESTRLFVEAPTLALVSAADAAGRAILAERMSEHMALSRLIALAMEMTGSYVRNPMRPADGDVTFGCEPLANVSEMSALLDQLCGKHGVKLARRALLYANDGSGSPMETLWYLLFCLPPSLGGLHLERPLQNVALDIPEGMRNLTCHRRLRPDFYWPRYQRVGEYDSSLHKDENSFYEDRRRAKDYGLLGLAYFPITDRDTASSRTVKAFLAQLAKSVEHYEEPSFARRMKRILRDPKVDAAREVLRGALMPPPTRWRDV